MKMAQYFQSDDDANIWPAVTDTILLIASIFIIFSILLMILMIRQISGEMGKGKSGGELIATTYRIPEGILFESGHTGLRPGAEEVLSAVLGDAPEQIEKITAYARKIGWHDFYIVIEAAGHADCDRAASSEYPGGDGNWDLSTKRANAVIHSMEGLIGSKPGLKNRLRIRYTGELEARPGSTVLRASGYSSHLPCTSYPKRGSGAFNRARNLNRRVEIRLFAEPSEVLRIREGE